MHSGPCPNCGKAGKVITAVISEPITLRENLVPAIRRSVLLTRPAAHFLMEVLFWGPLASSFLFEGLREKLVLAIFAILQRLLAPWLASRLPRPKTPEK